MNYPVVSITTAGEELNRLHQEIEGKLRSTVQDAIRAGEILALVKTRVGHGDFLAWVKANCRFSERTAQNYMRLYAYRSKTASVADLQEAYRQVETLEAQEKRTEGELAEQRVQTYLKTGVKSDGWRRGTDDKLAEEERARDERVEKAKLEMEEARLRKEEDSRGFRQAQEGIKETIDLLKGVAEEAVEHTEKRLAFKERIRLSQDGSRDPFVDALMDYLEELADDNRRLEACQNIIKVCRNVAVALQQEGE